MQQTQTQGQYIPNVQPHLMHRDEGTMYLITLDGTITLAIKNQRLHAMLAGLLKDLNIFQAYNALQEDMKAVFNRERDLILCYQSFCQMTEQ